MYGILSAFCIMLIKCWCIIFHRRPDTSGTVALVEILSQTPGAIQIQNNCTWETFPKQVFFYLNAYIGGTLIQFGWSLKPNRYSRLKTGQTSFYIRNCCTKQTPLLNVLRFKYKIYTISHQSKCGHT